MIETMKKCDKLILFNLIYISICICLQEVGNSSFLNSFSNFSLFLNHYRTVLRRIDMKIPGMYGLHIGIYNSCQFTKNNLKYGYIFLVNKVH